LLAVNGSQHPWGAFVGGMSYPLYLNHWIGVIVGRTIVKPFGMEDSVVRHVLSIVISLALAALLYWQVDRRILAARPRLYTPRIGYRSMVTAYAAVILGICTGLALSFYRGQNV
jgi:peptidoglycan/LPS O-acetylase OafA/YrhL